MTPPRRSTDEIRDTSTPRPSAAHPARERLYEQAKEVSKDIHDMGAIAKDAAHEKLGELRDDATVYYERGRDKVQGAVSGFEQYVRDHPLRSILLAAGVGVACNYFWRRR